MDNHNKTSMKEEIEEKNTIYSENHSMIKFLDYLLLVIISLVAILFFYTFIVSRNIITAFDVITTLLFVDPTFGTFLWGTIAIRFLADWIYGKKYYLKK